jgi:hypothetical protein
MLTPGAVLQATVLVLSGFLLTGWCDVPKSETSVWDGWNPNPMLGSIGQWRQTLMPTTTDFSGRSVKETSPGAGIDNCWYKGSALPRADMITGGTWTVNVGNTWGDDNVGWTPGAVAYYRAKARTPCGFTIYQQMTIFTCPGDYVNYGPVNTLMGIIDEFGTRSVCSSRVGMIQCENWP